MKENKRINKKVLLFLAKGFEEYEAAVFTDVFGWSRMHGLQPVDLITTGLRDNIKGTWNLQVIPELDFKDININDYDALAIPGGFEEAGFYEDAFDKRFLELIQEFNKQKKLIASVCVGAIPVGKSGVLKGRNATTYDMPESNRRNQLKAYGANLTDDLIVVDKNIITSTGPSTGLGVAFKLLEMLTSEENVKEVRKYMRFR